jgi:sugar O-acyltransferase (sialic acid O-acetyltransferase NeuD family)
MRLLVYGSKSFAATVAELAVHCGRQVVGFVDDYQCGAGILGSFDEVRLTHPPDQFAYAVGIGYTNLPGRWAAWKRITAAGYQAPALVHPRSYVADSADVGAGSLLMAGSIVDIRARVGDLVVVWPQACINHDAIIGANSFISPGAIVCGGVDMGAHCFVGAGAAIADRCHVPESSFVKMLTRYTANRHELT